MIELFIHNGIDINIRNGSRWNALHLLCRYNQSQWLEDVVKVLMEHGMDTNAVNNDHWNALMFLCGFNQTIHLYPLLKLLINSGIELNITNEFGQNALHLLCCYNTTDDLLMMIQLLVENGIDFNAQTNQGWNVIHYLCRYCKNNQLEDILEYLLGCGVNVNSKNNDEWNALHFLCRYNQSYQLNSLLELMIQHGIDLNAKEVNGWSALHFLTRYNAHANVHSAVKLVVEKGIDCNIRNNDGWNAAHLLACHHFTSQLTPIIELLVNNNLDVNSRTNNSWNLLHFICRYNRGNQLVFITKLLIENGIDLNASSIHGQTAFHLLFMHNTSEQLHSVFRLLLEFGMDVNSPNCFGDTVIISAARIGCMEAVGLLSAIVHFNVIDHFDRNAVDYLKDILSNSFPLCSICCTTRINLDPVWQDSLSSKRTKKYPRPIISRNVLESCLPANIDYGYYSNEVEAVVNNPSGTLWSRLIEAWNCNQLDICLVDEFLDAYCHPPERPGCRWCQVSLQVNRFLAALIDKVGDLDDRMEADWIVKYGSSAENSKIIAPDEYDFMVLLKNFRQLEANSSDVIFTGRGDNHIFCDNNGNISSNRVLFYYFQLLEIAVERVYSVNITYKDVAYGETCTTFRLIYLGPEPPPLHLSMDITVGVRVYEANILSLPSWCQVMTEMEEETYLVPFRKTAHHQPCQWRSSFPSLERDILLGAGPVVLSCFQILKILLILCHSKPGDENLNRKCKPSSYAIKTCLFRYMVNNPPPWNTNDRIVHCIGVCQTFLNQPVGLMSFFDDTITVYFINQQDKQVVSKIRDQLMSLATN